MCDILSHFRFPWISTLLLHVSMYPSSVQFQGFKPRTHIYSMYVKPIFTSKNILKHVCHKNGKMSYVCVSTPGPDPARRGFDYTPDAIEGIQATRNLKCTSDTSISIMHCHSCIRVIVGPSWHTWVPLSILLLESGLFELVCQKKWSHSTSLHRTFNQYQVKAQKSSYWAVNFKTVSLFVDWCVQFQYIWTLLRTRMNLQLVWPPEIYKKWKSANPCKEVIFLVSDSAKMANLLSKKERQAK